MKRSTELLIDALISIADARGESDCTATLGNLVDLLHSDIMHNEGCNAQQVYVLAEQRKTIAVRADRMIERDLLRVMVEDTPSYYSFGYYFPFKYFERQLGYDIEVIRGVLRSLRNRGFTEYGTGFTEDGMTAGAGYTMTRKGLEYYKELNKEHES